MIISYVLRPNVETSIECRHSFNALKKFPITVAIHEDIDFHNVRPESTIESDVRTKISSNTFSIINLLAVIIVFLVRKKIPTNDTPYPTTPLYQFYLLLESKCRFVLAPSSPINKPY